LAAPESPSTPTFHLHDDREDREDEEEEVEELQEEIEEGEDSGDSHLTNSLISPRLPVEKKFTLSTVMHIYFTESKQAQVYKSVLVSEKATTVEVIAQALERYNMKCSNPHEYTLYDIIGKWQDVTNTLRSQLNSMGLQHNTTLPNMNILNASPLIQRRTSVEEFVVCYCRELAPDESPYNTQFYLTAQEGFNRRFELRSKGSPNPMSRGVVSHEKSHSVDIMERPDEVTPTPMDVMGEGKKPSEERDEFGGIFGNTTHRKRARRNRIGNQSVDSADPDTQVTILGAKVPSSVLPQSESREGEGLGGARGSTCSPTNVGFTVRENRADGDHSTKMSDSEIPISLNKSHAPDFSTLCSSPDSGVEFNKQANSTKSSVSSEQYSSNDQVAVYPANLNCPFLLSLRLQDPSREHLVHKLTSDTTEMGVWSPMTDDTSGGRIQLRCPDLEGPLCCLCRQPIAEESSPSSSPKNPNSVPIFTHNLQRVHPEVPISVNGDQVAHSAILRHGDIVTIASIYFFMFIDYTSEPVNSGSHFDWKFLSSHHRSSSQQTGKMTASMETITEFNSSRKTRSGCDVEGEDDTVSPLRQNQSDGGRETSSSSHKRRVLSHIPSSKGKENVADTSTGGHNDSPSRRRGSNGASSREPKDRIISGTTSPSKQSPQHKKRSENSKTKLHQQALNKTHSLPLPQDRKLVFSFRTSEEDALLRHVVSARATSNSHCKLAPAYILAMCTEYSMMSGSPKQVLRFVQKATDRIQEVVWVRILIIQILTRSVKLPVAETTVIGSLDKCKNCRNSKEVNSICVFALRNSPRS
jgi:hypothetical protein